MIWVAEAIKEMLALKGLTKVKILNSTVNNLAETLQNDYYIVLIIYNSAKKFRSSSLTHQSSRNGASMFLPFCYNNL